MRSVLTQTSPLGQGRETQLLSDARSHRQALSASSRNQPTTHQTPKPALCPFNVKGNLGPCTVVCSEWLPTAKHALWEFASARSLLSSSCSCHVSVPLLSTDSSEQIIRIICLAGLRNCVVVLVPVACSLPLLFDRIITISTVNLQYNTK